MPRRLLSAIAPLALALALAGCGSGESDPETDEATSSPTSSGTSDSPSQTPSASETPAAGTTIELTRQGGVFDPNGARVEAEAGELISLVITSDEAGELHVHSTPEQEVAYGPGTSTHELTIDIPGVVEVESHDPDGVVLQLEVR